jgi:hypothetical protein
VQTFSFGGAIRMGYGTRDKVSNVGTIHDGLVADRRPWRLCGHDVRVFLAGSSPALSRQRNDGGMA